MHNKIVLIVGLTCLILVQTLWIGYVHGLDIRQVQLTNGIVLMVDYETGEIITQDKMPSNIWVSCKDYSEICNNFPEMQELDPSEVLLYKFDNNTIVAQNISGSPIVK